MTTLFTCRKDWLGRRGYFTNMASCFMGCLLICFIVGCKDSSPDPATLKGGAWDELPDTWQVSFVTDHYEEACPPVRVIHNDEIVAEYDWQTRDGSPISHRIDGALLIRQEYNDIGKDSPSSEYRPEYLNPDYRFEQLTPFGWREFFKPKEREQDMNKMEMFRKWGRDDPNHLTIKMPKPTSFMLVDNRDHKAVMITCGELSLRINENSTAKYWFNFDGYVDPDVEVDSQESNAQQDDAETNWEVLLDGSPIGMMGKYYGESRLVDVSGQRRYSLKQVIYSAYESHPFDPKPTKATFKNRQLHHFPEHLHNIDYLFESAPSEIETPHGIETRRWVLVDEK